MKNFWFTVAVVSFGFLFSGPVMAQEAASQENTASCPEISVLQGSMRAKRNEIKAVDDQIKKLRVAQKAEKESEQAKKRAQKQAALEELKLSDPVKYQQEKDKQFKRQKAREKVRKEKMEESPTKPKISHAQWLEQLKRKNPKMYELAVKKDALQQELGVLRSQLKRCYGDAPQGATPDARK